MHSIDDVYGFLGESRAIGIMAGERHGWLVHLMLKNNCPKMSLGAFLVLNNGRTNVN